MKKILYVDMDNVLVDFQSGISQVPDEILKQYEGHYDNIPGLFARMVPMPDAIPSFHTLAEVFDTYILSTALWRNPSAWSDKLQWVQDHLGQAGHKRLILTHHKSLNRGDFLIDDREKHGAKDFMGEHIHFGTERFPHWQSVVEYLLEQKT